MEEAKEKIRVVLSIASVTSNVAANQYGSADQAMCEFDHKEKEPHAVRGAF